MKKMFAAALALTLASGSLVAGGALAQAPDRAGSPAPTNRDAQVTRYEFEDHAVDGTGQGPNMSGIQVLLHARRDTLIQPRVHYVNELLKSVETL